MAVTLLRTKDTEQALHFPLGGLNVASAFAKQPNVPIDKEAGWYARTTPIAHNVRAFDADGRARGGSRPGIDKYVIPRLPGAVMNLTSVVAIAPGDVVQTSSLGRLIVIVAVANGNIRTRPMGAERTEAWDTPTNGTSALNATGVIFSANNGGRTFFADGTNAKYFEALDGAVLPWTLTAGSFPTDSDNNLPRLICNYYGCIVQSGLIGFPNNLFFSRVGDPFDYDYSGGVSQSVTQAVDLSASPLGEIGDAVTALMPFRDDVLIVGGDHSIEAIQGHPGDGGRRINVSDTVGAAWGAAYCSDPQGYLYFFSSDCGIYRIDPLSGKPQPIRISQQIDPMLRSVNTGANTISMVWDRAAQGMHVFVTRTAGPYAAVHLFYEGRTNSWFTVGFKNKMHNPLCAVNVDGNTTDDRAVLIGSWDGYVRWWNPAATRDDGFDIASKVVIGPLLTNNLDQIQVQDMHGVFGESGGEVNYKIYTGKTAEAAIASRDIKAGKWGPGRNHTVPVNKSGYAVYLGIDSLNPWATEQISMTIRGLGPVLRRGA